MLCPKCRLQIALQSAKFCPNCGASVNLNTHQQAVPQRRPVQKPVQQNTAEAFSIAKRVVTDKGVQNQAKKLLGSLKAFGKTFD